jgi:hypothetical protein
LRSCRTAGAENIYKIKYNTEHDPLAHSLVSEVLALAAFLSNCRNRFIKSGAYDEDSGFI